MLARRRLIVPAARFFGSDDLQLEGQLWQL
jgi:hypothetical protein